MRQPLRVLEKAERCAGPSAKMCHQHCGNAMKTLANLSSRSIKRLLTLLLLATLCLILPAGTQADDRKPDSDATERSGLLNLPKPDPRAVDFFIPVITMEQFYAPYAKFQGYRIQIFKDGRGIYHGLKNVKTLGEIRFQLKLEEVVEILKEFDRFMFWRVPENQYGLSGGFGVMPWEFTVRDKGNSKTIRFSSQSQAFALQQAIEARVSSEKWRCPYMDEDERNPCDRHRQRQGIEIPYFINHDLPLLKRIYE